jgi:hypothetical protein
MDESTTNVLRNAVEHIKPKRKSVENRTCKLLGNIEKIENSTIEGSQISIVLEDFANKNDILQKYAEDIWKIINSHKELFLLNMLETLSVDKYLYNEYINTQNNSIRKQIESLASTILYILQNNKNLYKLNKNNISSLITTHRHHD